MNHRRGVTKDHRSAPPSRYPEHSYSTPLTPRSLLKKALSLKNVLAFVQTEPWYLRFRLCFVTLITCVVLSGCYNLDTDEYPRAKPGLQDIEGVYFLTGESSKNLHERAGDIPAEISIKLSPDGNCRLLNIPDSWGDETGHSPVKFVTRTGKWEEAKSQKFWDIALDLDAVDQLSEIYTSLSIVGQKPPYYLWINFDDPDQGHALVFAKH
jgi:hypothetical protein